MPGREATSVSKAKKRSRSDQRLDVELPPAREGGLMIHPFGIQAMCQGIRQVLFSWSGPGDAAFGTTSPSGAGVLFGFEELQATF